MNPMSICSSSSSSSSSTKSWIVHGLLVGAAAAVAIGAHAYFFLGRSGRFRSRVIGIIPARFASTRFEGKPLVEILGKPMIQVYPIPLSLLSFWISGQFWILGVLTLSGFGGMLVRTRLLVVAHSMNNECSYDILTQLLCVQDWFDAGIDGIFG